MRTLLAVASLIVVVVVVSGCSRGDGSSLTQGAATLTAPYLVPAAVGLRQHCRATAGRVRYAVPCPTRVPLGLTATGGSRSCKLDILGPGGTGGCAKSWRNWVVGSSETADQHLVIVGSPTVLRSDARVVNGPAWYRGARERRLKRLTINGWRMHAVYVPPQTNDGSAFADHVVLIWAVGGHTYGIGFHNVRGLRETLDLDVALARGVRLVAPEVGS